MYGVSQSYISKKMEKYKIKTRKVKKWNKNEEKILKKNYLKVNKDKLLKLLPKRTWRSIICKARKMGLSRKIEEYRKSKEIRERLRNLSKKNEIKVNFKKQKNIAYVVGVIDGDGFHNKVGTLGLEVNSSKFADKFYNNLKEIGLRPGRGIRSNRNRQTVWASSTILVKWYMGMNYSKKMKWLCKNKKNAWKYIEGRYESDGNIHPCGSPRICSYDEKSRKFLFELLSFLGIKCSIQQNNVWISKISAHDFFKNINPVLRRFKK